MKLQVKLAFFESPCLGILAAERHGAGRAAYGECGSSCGGILLRLHAIKHTVCFRVLYLLYYLVRGNYYMPRALRRLGVVNHRRVDLFSVFLLTLHMM